MTREEIIEKAEALVYDLRSGGRGQNGDEYQAEQAMLALARATLEEAARAACVGCDSTDKLFNDGVAWMHRDESPSYDGPYYRCMATKIHDLIAALDKEGDRE